MSKVRRLAVGVLALALLAGGCGSDSSEQSSDDPRDASEISSDKKTASETVFRLSDFPSGWEGKPASDAPDSAEQEAAEKAFASCLDVDPALLGVGEESEAQAESDDFSDSDNHEASNSVTVVATVERAQEQLEIFRKPEAATCFETFVNKAIDSTVNNPDPGEEVPQGVTFGKATVEALEIPGLPEDSVAYRATVPVSAAGQTIEASFDIVAALKGRTGTTFTFISIGETFPSGLESQLIDKVLARAPAS